MTLAKQLGLVALTASLLAFCASAKPSEPIPQPAKPTLLLFITVDQLRADYLDRFRPQLTGGLARLAKGGALFTDAHQDHAITETAPGHASTMSGRFPRSTGITRNVAGVNDPKSPLIGATDLGASPFRFRGTTLTDWLTTADPKTRAFSVSSKDRGAILPIGRSKQDVYWFANNGTFTTSVYYRDTLPSWIAAFNARRLPHHYAGQAWNLLLPADQYSEPDSVPAESGGRDFVFPHPFPTDSAAAAAAMRYTPMIDQLTLDFALEGLHRLDLGRGPTTDVLAISLSATDYVGHFFGPGSRELHDQILRLDRSLGAFLDSLYAIRDSAQVVIALTADHGVGQIPELNNAIRVSLDPAIMAARALIVAGGGDSTAVELESGALFLDSRKLGNQNADKVVSTFMTAARAIVGVMRVDKWSDLKKMNPRKDEIARRWAQMFPDDIAPVVAVTLKPGNIANYPITATHGSPHRYDSNVPIIFYGAPFKPGRYSDFVRTVDIAPTLAKVLGVTPTESLDGHPLLEAVR